MGLPGKLAFRLMFAIAVAFSANFACALPFTFSGSLNDPGNANLFGSDLGAPSFDESVQPIANNVAIYTFNLSAPLALSFASYGYAAGGIDPYFTLFLGTGSGATFLASNYDNAFLGSGGDFTLIVSLAAGDYTVAIGAFANMSFAENLGTGTLGDGFVQLGFGDLGNFGYRLVADAATSPPLPEPPTPALLAAAGLAMVWLRRPRRELAHSAYR